MYKTTDECDQIRQMSSCNNKIMEKERVVSKKDNASENTDEREKARHIFG